MTPVFVCMYVLTFKICRDSQKDKNPFQMSDVMNICILVTQIWSAL